MKELNEKQLLKDKHDNDLNSADYLDRSQYEKVAVMLGFTHIILEVVYISIGCFPMAVINIFSFLCYVFSYRLVKQGKQDITVWIMLLEVYFHVIFSTVFLGFECGFALWLFGSFCSVFLPYFSGRLKLIQKIQIGVFGTVIVISFLILSFMDVYKILPTRYNLSPEASSIFFHINAVITFSSIMLYTTIYNSRMNAKNRELEIMANHDYLTGCYNRQKLQSIIQSELENEENSERYTMAVAIMDIDFFKTVNDTYGHVAGDDVLKETVRIFSKYEKSGLFYGRWGGEEFLLVSSDELGYEEFCSLIEAMREEISNHVYMSGKKKIHVTASFGTAFYEKGMSVESLVNKADSRLYIAKETGRNKVINA